MNASDIPLESAGSSKDALQEEHPWLGAQNSDAGNLGESAFDSHPGLSSLQVPSSTNPALDEGRYTP